ncbi:hypothetical protein SDRG_06355 [Saprolegnia diclina VS20]|uniref:Uncharacterized protein n=1 Tax=Saprolegnia diclina (strain VS20) TaxID=1156394 RepID=T0QQR4_SAPDV|nr:hypothetical protein SDRG_06355 [Saprolegnia diclina VS20]EQC36250.1 hypothetical protein SDRG_06355 [Saprolegnia diclina VS20]|eukprot:XP_008610356.1 hypothetical protein SDRG_06355 [Saprolegnia diclina VS20]
MDAHHLDDVASVKSGEGNAVAPSRWMKLVQWYIAPPTETANTKRYCGRRLSKRGCILLHVVVLLVLALMSIGLVLVYVVVPHMIQARFASAMAHPLTSESSNDTTGVVRPSDGTADFRVRTTLPALLSIGGTVELVGISTYVIADKRGKTWATVTMSPVTFAVNAPANISVDFNLSVIATPSSEVLATMFPERQLALHIATRWTIRFWGSIWYSELPLSGVYTLSLPHTLQDQFDAVIRNPLSPSPSSSGANVTVEVLSASDGSFRLNATVPALSLLPGTIRIVGPTVIVISDPQRTPFGHVTFEAVTLPMDRVTRLSVTGAWSLVGMPTASVLLSAVQSNSFRMHVDSNWTIEAWHQIWFAPLALHSQFDLNSTTGAQFWQLVQCKLYVC